MGFVGTLNSSADRIPEAIITGKWKLMITIVTRNAIIAWQIEIIRSHVNNIVGVNIQALIYHDSMVKY